MLALMWVILGSKPANRWCCSGTSFNCWEFFVLWLLKCRGLIQNKALALNKHQISLVETALASVCCYFVTLRGFVCVCVNFVSLCSCFASLYCSLLCLCSYLIYLPTRHVHSQFKNGLCPRWPLTSLSQTMCPLTHSVIHSWTYPCACTFKRSRVRLQWCKTQNEWDLAGMYHQGVNIKLLRYDGSG